MKIHIQHDTSYRYAQPVNIFVHEVRLRPREGQELEVLSFDLVVEPDAQISWIEDAFGNRVARLRFTAPTDQLVIKAKCDLTLSAERWPLFDIAPHIQVWPFDYGRDAITLTPFTEPVFGTSQAILRARTGPLRSAGLHDTLTLLKDVNTSLFERLEYQMRETEGTQTPSQTLLRGTGTCRDFAVLFADYVRTLGIAARLVSGYLMDPELEGHTPDTSTHAWVEVYLPNAGWIAFDPTHGRMGTYGLVALAVGRTMEDIAPITGAISVEPSAPAMTVNISYSVST
ncbi:transglutaminase N-terminal domain-containing protein [Asticcacaulis sp.]|uniref:transglutaminase family protein n=1 Tax=Asticcacaulis sp. TaxID=1872648 RepID=UPI00391963F0